MKKLDINKAHDLYHVTVRMTKLCGSCGSSLELLDESLDKSLAQIFYWLCRLQSRQPSISFSLSNAVFFFYFIPFFCSPCFYIVYQFTISIPFFAALSSFSCLSCFSLLFKILIHLFSSFFLSFFIFFTRPFFVIFTICSLFWFTLRSYFCCFNFFYFLACLPFLLL